MPGPLAVDPGSRHKDTTPVIPFGVGAPIVPTAPDAPATEGDLDDVDLPGDPYFDDNFSIVPPSDGRVELFANTKPTCWKRSLV